MEIQRRWQECPRDETPGRWAAIYATMNPKGEIMISRFTYEMMQSPEAFVLLYDRTNNTIGLRPARMRVVRNAFPTRGRGRHGGRVVRAYRLCCEFGITVPETIRFTDPAIDSDGVLLLDLRTARPASRKRH